MSTLPISGHNLYLSFCACWVLSLIIHVGRLQEQTGDWKLHSNTLTGNYTSGEAITVSMEEEKVTYSNRREEVALIDNENQEVFVLLFGY